MSKTVQMTAMLHVPDFAEALEFFTRVLGFAALFRATIYAYVERKGAGVRIAPELPGSRDARP